jgi:hypothetical protein
VKKGTEANRLLRAKVNVCDDSLDDLISSSALVLARVYRLPLIPPKSVVPQSPSPTVVSYDVISGSAL